MTGSNNTGNPNILVNHGESRALSYADHPHAQLDPHGLPPVAPAPRSPSSRGTTPDATPDTVLQVLPAHPMVASDTPVSTPTCQAAAHASPEPPPGDAPVLDTIAVPAEDQDSGSLESFMEFLDVAEEEFELRHEVGRRKIDVILHDGYEYRRDRAAHRWRLSQLWVCRYASKTKCKGKFHLNVQDLTDFMTGATVCRMVDHNHPPRRVKSYGLAEVTEIVSVGSSSTNDTQSSNAHAISQISEGDFSVDFEQSNLDAKARSSPVAMDQGDWTQTDDLTTPSSTRDTSWDLVGVSQEDANGYQAVKHIRRGKNRQDLSEVPPEPSAPDFNA